mgnify:CR=1 FL=1
MFAVGGCLELTSSFGNQTLTLQAGSNGFQVIVLLVILLDLLLETFRTVTAFMFVKQYLDAVIQLLALFKTAAGFAL